MLSSSITSVRAALQRQQELVDGAKDSSSKDLARQLLVAHGDRRAVEGRVEASEAVLVKLASKMQHALTGKGATNTGQRLRAVARAARQLGMSVDSDAADVFLSHPTFYVEINFDAEDDDVVKDLKITHNRSGDEERDAAILGDLQNGRMAEFLAGMQRICELHGPDEEEADSKEEPTKFSALCALEADMLAIHAVERSNLSLKDLVLRGHGMMRPRLGGQMLRLAYFGAPTQLGDAAAVGEGDHSEAAWKAATHALTLGVTSLPSKRGGGGGSGEVYSRIPLSGRQRLVGPSKKQKEANVDVAGFEFDRTEETSPTPPPCISLLQLEEPLATSVRTAKKLASIASKGQVAATDFDRNGDGDGVGGSAAAANAREKEEAWNHLPSVQALIVGENPPTTTTHGCTYRFAARRSCRGVWLETAHVGRAEQLHPILQLLRQQQTFNVLLKSCTEDTVAESDDSRSTCTVEVSSTAPSSIQLNSFLPELSAMLCVEITIEVGGAISCVASSSAKAPLGDGTGAFKRLTENLSIPAMMQEYLIAATPQGSAASKRAAQGGAAAGDGRSDKRGRNV